ncbi:riboflavin synthase [Spirulina subsalsa FACHB-351]|uniref:Riboflavin synthase n=1 Tax=Spirulina subsalsa FACHB-351 TaxID=234711 RepID=A0ABT3LBX9_9CYAN|nr:riboflavin synthase [Spirulina subsalsa]MCW6038637.1 riboflavin synthase [Spirulina subsalsa FACHB-351]
MFTGIIQAQGILEPYGNDQFAITLEGATSSSLVAEFEVGDSVAVDGICLTIETILGQGFVATASPETLQRTSLGQRCQERTPVNIETALRVGSKLGGHFVSGHVDGVGCLVEALPQETSWQIRFAPVGELGEQWQRFIAPYLVSKGSIAVNGISLTIADCDSQGQWFTVAVIPHTYAETNLSVLEPGAWVNLEGDILGKYVAKLLSYPQGSKGREVEAISLEFLSEHGYL